MSRYAYPMSVGVEPALASPSRPALAGGDDETSSKVRGKVQVGRRTLDFLPCFR